MSDVQVTGHVTLPPGMTQEEADRLVREGDERAARLDAERAQKGEG